MTDLQSKAYQVKQAAGKLSINTIHPKKDAEEKVKLLAEQVSKLADVLLQYLTKKGE